MAYSTEAQIRGEAGFTDNANITAVKITGYQSAATSQIDGVLRRVYSLPLSSVPEILRLVEQKLAAGHLLLDQFGTEAEGTDFDGQKKVDWAEDQLTMIESGVTQLVDTSGESLTKVTSTQMQGFPNSTAGTDKTSQADKDDPPIFEIGEEF